MAAYVGLAFLSFLWGSSFLLIKIASRAFDPFDFALARVSGRGDAADQRPFEEGLAGITTCTMGKLFALALIGQVVPVLLLGEAATLTTSADMALMMGAQPISVLLFGRFLGSRDRWTGLARLWPRLRWGRRGILVARSGQRRPFRFRPGLRPGPRASPMEQAQSSRARQRAGNRRREGGDRLDDDFDARAHADRLAFGKPPPFAAVFPHASRPDARHGRARRLQHCARLLRLFPARPRRGTDFCEPKQLHRARDRRRRRGGRAR